MRKFILLTTSALLLAACSSDPLKVDVSGVKADIAYTNYDSLLFAQQNESAVATLANVDPEAVDYLFGYCLGIGKESDSGFYQRLDRFKTDSYILALHNSISKKFADLPARHQKIVDGFRHLKKHIPDVSLPQNLIYADSYFTSSAFSAQHSLVVGLERYLGEKNAQIGQLPPDQFYQWIKEGMDDRYLERDAVTSWTLTHVMPEMESDATVIDELIYWGKVLYLAEAAFPDADKSVILRYPKKDFDWAMANETQFWDYLVKEKLLFSKDEKAKANFTHEGPFTPGLPEEGPDRLGQFLGWRIVHSYVEQYDVTLPQLLKLSANELLQEYEID